MSRSPSFPPFYDHEFQLASENLRRALPYINHHLTPVNPVNYAVWYEYVSGENQDLNKEIDALLTTSQPITTDTTQALYEKYVLMDMPNRLNSTNNGLKLVVDNTLDKIHQTEDATGRFSLGLSSKQSMLERCEDVSQLKQLITEILDNTQQLNDTSHELKEELIRSGQEISRLREELEAVKHSARTDGLTGLLNRGAFNHEIHNLFEQQEQRFCLALIDIDHFKKINDSFGHVLGDKVLQFFATILQKYTNGRHISARYGGEEMAVLLVDMQAQEALTLMEEIRTRFANSSLKKKGSDETIGQVTVSIGISAAEPTDTPQSLIERTDRALYRSKENGRNQTTLV